MSARRGWTRWSVSLLGLLLAVGTRVARADGASLGVRYTAPPECPSEAVWRERLRRRLPPLLWTHPLVDALSVNIEREGAGQAQRYVGTLDGIAELGLGGARGVRGARCDEVLDALSFSAALGLERAASSGAPLMGEAQTSGAMRDDEAAALPAPDIDADAIGAEEHGLKRGSSLGVAALMLVEFLWRAGSVRRRFRYRGSGRAARGRLSRDGADDLITTSNVWNNLSGDTYTAGEAPALHIHYGTPFSAPPPR